MICFPNAKINIGLYVLDVRPDGKHNLETVFLPIPLQDVLEVRYPINSSLPWVFVQAGLQIPGSPDDNLVVRVYRSLQQEFQLPACEINLYKRIPMGAGLGGGSSDAAFMMRLLNENFQLGLTNDEMKRRMSQFGADCPFFIDDKPAFATGIGDQLSPLSVSVQGLWIVLVKPPCHVSTSEAYSHVSCRDSAPVDLRKILMQPISRWRDCVENDFELSVFLQYPEIAAIKSTLYDMGALYASMSGSGSAVYGLFDFPFESPQQVFPQYFCYQAPMSQPKPVF